MWFLSGPVPVFAAAAAMLLIAAAIAMRPRKRARVPADPDIRQVTLAAPGPISDAPMDPETIEAEWERLKTDYETRHKCKLICIIHEGNEGLGETEATDVVQQIMSVKAGTPIHVVLHTLGGLLMASERVADALAGRQRTSAYVPYYAMSGGTEIALATEMIYLGKHANLGPTDVQFGGVAARDFERLVEEKGIKELDDESALMAIRARRIKRDVATVCKRINDRHKPRDGWFGKRSCELAQKLIDGSMDHSHRITLGEARKLKINVSSDVPKDVYALVNRRREQIKMLYRFAPMVRIVAAKAQSPDAAQPGRKSR